jgi:hypothetical protein
MEMILMIRSIEIDFTGNAFLKNLLFRKQNIFFRKALELPNSLKKRFLITGATARLIKKRFLMVGATATVAKKRFSMTSATAPMAKKRFSMTSAAALMA